MRISGPLLRFARCERGTMLSLWAVSFAVLFGIVALSFDMGRVAASQTELQSFADQVALAAAGELDGASDAITRATAAAAQIQDRQSFASGGNALSGGTDVILSFLSDLPDDDSDLMTSYTANPKDAMFARAVVTTRTVDMTFGAVFAALTGQQGLTDTVRASAVAGFTQYACDITPLMFCIPSATFKAAEHTGAMVNLRSSGNGAAWAPGDFGFLDPSKGLTDTTGPCAGKNGNQLDACLIGATGSVTQCFSIRGVDIEPGQKVGIENAAFNVRFDMYHAVMNGKKNDPDYAPAPNVIKGIVPKSGQCIGNNEEVSPDTLGLPRDDCFGAGTCGRYGDGDWSAGRTAYVSMNYGGVDPHPAAQTRYQYYLAEIDAAGGGGSSTNILSGLSETGRPQCSNNQSTDPERRVVVAAGIDCAANGISGAATNVPVKEFVKIFLTEPVGSDGNSPPTMDIWGEIIGPAGGDGAGNGLSGGIFRDVVQLYR